MIKVCQSIVTGWWFSSDTPVSSTNKTDHHDIAEILLKVALNTITLTPMIIIRIYFFMTECHIQYYYAKYIEGM